MPPPGPSPDPSPGPSPSLPPSPPFFPAVVSAAYFRAGYSVFGLVSTAVVAILLFGSTVWAGVRRLCRGVYKPSGHAKPAGFTEVAQINAYLPGVRP